MNIEVTGTDIIDCLYKLEPKRRIDIIYRFFIEGTETKTEERELYKRIKEYMGKDGTK